MYRREILVTGGKDKIVLLMNNGMGIKDFKIFSQGKDYVEVGFNMIPVRTTGIKTFYKNTYIERTILQAYYVLDLKTKKLLRVNSMKNFAKVNNWFKKTVVMFGIWRDVDFEIDQEKYSYKVNAYDRDGKALKCPATVPFVDEDDMPGRISILDFKDCSVYNVDQMIFLDFQ